MKLNVIGGPEDGGVAEIADKDVKHGAQFRLSGATYIAIGRRDDGYQLILQKGSL